MVWPASTGTLHDSFVLADKTAANIRSVVLQLRADSLAGPVIRQRLIDLMRQLQIALDRWAAVESVPGIVQYVRDQKGDQLLDVAADFAAMQTETAALRDWIGANFPADAGSGAWLVYDVDTGGNRTDLVFTTSQLDGFRTQADNLLAVIG